ncbi:MAG: pantoate--beta-alanine ligase [Omnitrophica WOR_2 bacterium SM23_29]|nr:MAG: pantoate--beta-alanine ligase [Omnitrophica WOR_2 bacterium SM23_29]
MKLIRSIREIQDVLIRERKKGKSIGFIPTMGYLHEGHLSLIRRGRRETDIVVVSIFVNPTQFGPRGDYRRYPRNLRRDLKLCGEEGVDYVFSPSVKSIYPKGYSTYVSVEGLTENLCGKFRPGHFKGVTTVVTKLFNIVKPDVAYFGQKDAQQAIVIRRMTDDLNMNIKIKVLPIIRENDGLAMSSRNNYLSYDERQAASTLYRSLQLARDLIKLGKKDTAYIIAQMRKMLTSVATKIDYISIVDSKTLKNVKTIKGKVLIALAVWVGRTRLIDNIVVRS